MCQIDEESAIPFVFCLLREQMCHPLSDDGICKDNHKGIHFESLLVGKSHADADGVAVRPYGLVEIAGVLARLEQFHGLNEIQQPAFNVF